MALLVRDEQSHNEGSGNPAKLCPTSQHYRSLYRTLRRSMNDMVEILVTAYLIVGLFAALLLWGALRSSKRPGENQTRNFEPVKPESALASKTEPVHLHLS